MQALEHLSNNLKNIFFYNKGADNTHMMKQEAQMKIASENNAKYVPSHLRFLKHLNQFVSKWIKGYKKVIPKLTRVRLSILVKESREKHWASEV